MKEVMIVQYTLADFARELERTRTGKGVSVATQARYLGISKEMYNEIEAGKRVPSSEVAIRLFAWAHHLRRFQDVIRAARVAEKEPEMPKSTVQVRTPVLRPEQVEALQEQVEMPRRFGPALTWLREEAGFTQAEVGSLMNDKGVTAAAVGHWETELNVPIKKHYEQLCDLFPPLRMVRKPDVRDIDKPVPGPRLAPPPALRVVVKQPEPEPKMPPNPPVQPPSINELAHERKRHMVNWTKTVVAFKNAPEKVQASVKTLLESADAMGFSIPELLEVLRDGD